MRRADTGRPGGVQENAENFGKRERGHLLLDDLIQRLGRQGKVVVLVDEYGKVLSGTVFFPEVGKVRRLVCMQLVLHADALS